MPARVRQRLERLILSELLTDSEIGRRVGLSHTTVWRVRNLLYGDDGEKAGSQLKADERYVNGKPPRCPDCGGSLNVIPCRLCRVARHMAADRAARQLGLIGAGLPPEKSLRLKQRQLDGFADGSPKSKIESPRSPFGRAPRKKKPPRIQGKGTGILAHYKRR
jgi:hypothetical protein